MDLNPRWNEPEEQKRRLEEMSTFGNLKMSVSDWASDAFGAVRKLEQTLHGVVDQHSPERGDGHLVCKSCLTEDPATGKALRVPYPCATVLFVAQNLTITVYKKLIERG